MLLKSHLPQFEAAFLHYTAESTSELTEPLCVQEPAVRAILRREAAGALRVISLDTGEIRQRGNSVFKVQYAVLGCK